MPGRVDNACRPKPNLSKAVILNQEVAGVLGEALHVQNLFVPHVHPDTAHEIHFDVLSHILCQ